MNCIATNIMSHNELRYKATFVQYICANNIQNIIDGAIAYGLLHYLHITSMNINLMSNINLFYSSKNVEVVQYLHDIGYNIDDLIHYANWSGHVNTLKYCHMYGTKCVITTDFQQMAAMCGRLECLKYIKQFNYPYCDQAVRYAAVYNKIDCLRYLLENGWPYDKEEIMSLLRGGCHKESIDVFNELGL